MAEKIQAGERRASNRYQLIIARLFEERHALGVEQFEFQRSDITRVAQELGIVLPANLGDVIYSVRYRTDMPPVVQAKTPEGSQWLIEGVARSQYRFRLARLSSIKPRADLVSIKVPDATPEIIGAYALGDEQALLAKVRYNRLVDVFLGISAFSLQNHLRTTVRGIGQIEIDELYVGLDRHGRQFVIPVQAKGGNDRHGAVQTQQDIACCREKFSHLICRPVSAQFLANNRIAMFELTTSDGEVKVVEERHYQLVAASEISHDDLLGYRNRARD